MDAEFERLKKVLSYSRCSKRKVVVGTYINKLWFWEVNSCFYEGKECPRLSLPSGVGYDLCESVHAEARLASLMKKENATSDGVAWVFGHYYACGPCSTVLKEVGVKEIRVRER